MFDEAEGMDTTQDQQQQQGQQQQRTSEHMNTHDSTEAGGGTGGAAGAAEEEEHPAYIYQFHQVLGQGTVLPRQRWFAWLTRREQVPDESKSQPPFSQLECPPLHALVTVSRELAFCNKTGTWGSVHLATDRRNNKQVAIKIMKLNHHIAGRSVEQTVCH